MISLDQILLLQQKVESAVEKITQLQAENDALRSKCSELSNALSSKSEQLSSFEQDQGKIENGILKALDRLNTIENTVLNSAAKEPSAPKSEAAPASGAAPAAKAAAAPVAKPAPVSAEKPQAAEPHQQHDETARPAEKPASGEFDIF